MRRFWIVYILFLLTAQANAQDAGSPYPPPAQRTIATTQPASPVLRIQPLVPKVTAPNRESGRVIASTSTPPPLSASGPTAPALFPATLDRPLALPISKDLPSLGLKRVLFETGPNDSMGAVSGPPLVEDSPPPSRSEIAPARTITSMGTGPQASAVILDKKGPAAWNIGRNFSYEIIVRNGGTVPVYQIRILDDLPRNVRFVGADPKPDIKNGQLIWYLDTLAPTTERHFKVEVYPYAEGELKSSATATFSTTSSLSTLGTRPQLSMTKTGPNVAQVGDQVPFEIRVTNTGNGPASNIIVRDEMPAGLQHEQGNRIETDLGNLAPGQSKTLTLRATATRLGRLVNQAFATGDDGLNASAQATVVVTEPVLSVRKTGPADSLPNRELEYHIEVTNVGTAPANNVQITDYLPEGLDFRSAGDSGSFEQQTKTVTWQIGTMLPNEHRSVVVKLIGKVQGDWTNRAVAQADRGVEAKSETRVHIEGVPALMLEVVDLDDPIEVGAETSYEIRVLNQGSCPCTGLQIRAIIPDGMQLVSADGPTPNKVQGQQVTFDLLPKFGTRADARYRVRVRGAKPGDWRFKAFLTCDQLTRPVYEEESTHVYAD